MDSKPKFNQNKYIQEYARENYDTRSIRFRKGKLEHIKKFADKAGESLNEYVVVAIDKRMESENSTRSS